MRILYKKILYNIIQVTLFTWNDISKFIRNYEKYMWFADVFMAVNGRTFAYDAYWWNVDIYSFIYRDHNYISPIH